MDMREANTVEPNATDWFCPERYGKRFPKGALTVIAGPPGVNKSTFSCDVAAQASHLGKVLLSNTEDDEGMLRLRLEYAGADLSNITFANPMFPEDMADVLNWIDTNDPARSSSILSALISVA